MLDVAAADQPRAREFVVDAGLQSFWFLPVLEPVFVAASEVALRSPLSRRVALILFCLKRSAALDEAPP